MKEQLIEKAKKFGFMSSMLWNYPYKYSADKESLRYCLWLEEFKRFLRENYEIFIYVIHDGDTFQWKLDDYFSYVDYSTGEGYKTYEEALESGLMRYLDIKKVVEN